MHGQHCCVLPIKRCVVCLLCNVPYFATSDASWLLHVLWQLNQPRAILCARCGGYASFIELCSSLCTVRYSLPTQLQHCLIDLCSYMVQHAWAKESTALRAGCVNSSLCMHTLVHRLPFTLGSLKLNSVSLARQATQLCQLAL